MTDVRQDQGSAQQQSGGDIRFFVKPSSDGGWDLGPTNPPAKGKAPIVLGHGDPGADIVIRLVGAGGNVKFNTADPVWIEENGSCPPKQGNNCPDQIDRVECDGNELRLHDTNTRACTMTYQMNFIGASPCDPEIRNGGGGGI